MRKKRTKRGVIQRREFFKKSTFGSTNKQNLPKPTTYLGYEVRLYKIFYDKKNTYESLQIVYHLLPPPAPQLELKYIFTLTKIII